MGLEQYPGRCQYVLPVFAPAKFIPMQRVKGK